MGSITKRRRADGKLVYQAKVRLKGAMPQSATFERKSDATKWMHATEASIREGRYFNSVEARKHNLADAIDRYMETILPTMPKVVKMYRGHLMWWKAEIGSYRLIDVEPPLIYESLERLYAKGTPNRAKIAPATVNRYRNSLSAVMSAAVEKWGWLEDSPMRKVPKFKEAKPRDRFLSKDEIERLLEACKSVPSPLLYPIVVLALATGARKGEILGLEWGDVSAETGRLIFRETKNGDTRATKISGEPLTILKELQLKRSHETPLLFPSERRPQQPVAIEHSWRMAMRKAEIEDFRFHDLRHTAASYLASNQATDLEIAHVLGHRTLQMVKRYSHLSEGHRVLVTERLVDEFFG